MTRRHRFAVVAAGLFLGLVLIEQLRRREVFDLWNFLGDLVEMALLAGAVALTAFTSVETRDIRVERLVLLDDLAKARRDGERWRTASAAHVEGLSRAIAGQFRTWALTEAEADVAGMMLKGLSHKEVATLRQCSEVTVRQHATVIYRKSGLTNRAQLTAFFLEDLLPAGRAGLDAEPAGGAADLRLVTAKGSGQPGP